MFYICGSRNKSCVMKKVSPRLIESFLLKNWFQVALIAIIGLAVIRNGSDSFDPLTDFEGIAKAERPIEKMGMSFLPDMFAEESKATPQPKVAKQVETKSAIKYESRAQAFIDRFSEVAIQENSKYNIPASVILANGILLSELGHSTLASEAQNYFMVPCTRSWDGDSMEIGDGCFRWYSSPWESFRDHSLFLCKEAGNDAMKIKKQSIVEWAKTIEKIGWTNLTAKDILKTIRKYNLLDLDA